MLMYADVLLCITYDSLSGTELLLANHLEE